jgi:anti-sigma-K factor RskA
MDYGRPDLVERLAAEYAAGTLRGGARRRFEALLPAHPALRRAVRDWDARLMPLTVTLPPEAPSPQVWERIRTRIEGPAAAASAGARPGLAGRLGFWRALSAFAGIAAVAFAALLVTPAPVAPPVVVVLASTGAPSGGTAPASFVASISGDGTAVVTRPLVPVGVQADRALELWALPKGGGAPRSLGLISPSGSTVLRKGKALLDSADGLAVSLEPPGGSPTGAPTGPVLYAGKLTL